MARPRTFDEDDVLERALQAFWARGYEGTSMADIEEATGLGRASIYAAFGDKEGLFVKVLERFMRRYDPLADALGSGPSVRQAFEQAREVWFGLNCSGPGPKGCLMQLASQSGATELPRVQAALGENVARTEAMVMRALERAKAAGELPPSASPTLLARFFSVGLQGLSSAARGGMSKRELRPVAHMLVQSIFGPPPSSSLSR
jgi:AcrR family transcriptional regulator